MGCAHAQHLLQEPAIQKGGPAQLGSVAPLAAPDHIVDGGEGKPPMVQMAVEHVGNGIGQFQWPNHTPQTDGARQPGARGEARPQTPSWRD